MFLRLYFGFLFLVCLLIFKSRCENITVFEQVGLIRSILERFDCHSVILIRGNTGVSRQNFLLQKYLSSSIENYVGIWSFKTFTRNMYSDEVTIPFRSLVVVDNNFVNIEELSLVSNKINIASFVWLILPKFSPEMDWNFNNLFVPFNCRFIISTSKSNSNITLYEIYRINKQSNFIIMPFGSWSSEKGLRNIKENHYNRRMNLQGHEFKFAVHNLTNSISPCTRKALDNGKQVVQCGYFRLWQTLGELLNYTNKYVQIEDCYLNGSKGLSTPMLEMIATGEVDSGEDGFVLSSARLMNNKFLWPLYNSNVMFLSKIPSRKFSFSSYLRPFTNSLWLTLFGWLLLCGTIINVIEHIYNKLNFKSKISSRIEFTENVFAPFAAICYQGVILISSRSALRLTYLMIYVIPIVFINSYSASVTSTLSVPLDDIPFTNLEEFEKDGTHHLGAINNTFFQFFIMTDSQFANLREKKLISQKIVTTYQEAIQEICSGRKTFIFEQPLLTQYSVECNVFKFDMLMTKVFSSMAVHKMFPYTEFFNRQIQTLIQAGIGMKMLEKITVNYYKYEIRPFPKHQAQVKPFGFSDVLPLFAVLISGIILASFLLLFEKCRSKRKLKLLENL